MEYACLWFRDPSSSACVGSMSCREQGICARLRAPGDAPQTMPATTADLDAEPAVGSCRVYHRPGGVAGADGDEGISNRIHILGASGSGTTLGRALAEHLQGSHFDTDDYSWLPTDPPHTQR